MCKIFHTIPMSAYLLHKSLRKQLIFWASNHDVNWCLANWGTACPAPKCLVDSDEKSLRQHTATESAACQCCSAGPVTKPLHLSDMKPDSDGGKSREKDV